MTNALPDASALTQQILAAAARVSGDLCILTVALLHTLLRVTVESTDESGGDYLRSAVGLDLDGALRSLLSVMADDADNDDADPEPPPPCVTLSLDLAQDDDADDADWLLAEPSDSFDAFDGCAGFSVDDLDGLALEMAARDLDAAGEWRVAS